MGTNLHAVRKRAKQPHRHHRERNERPVAQFVPGMITVVSLDQGDRDVLTKALRACSRDRVATELLRRIQFVPK